MFVVLEEKQRGIQLSLMKLSMNMNLTENQSNQALDACFNP